MHYPASSGVMGPLVGNDPHTLFDHDWYLHQNPDVEEAGVNPLVHYMLHGWKAGRDPNPLFSTLFYLEQNPDVADAGINPLVHYMLHGWQEGRDPHRLFSTKFYLENNPDVAAAEVNPLEHYLKFGAEETRDPHPQFNNAWYWEQNPDVAAAGMNPLVHYVLHGEAEGRGATAAMGGILQTRKFELCNEFKARLLKPHNVGQHSGSLISILVPVYNTEVEFLDRMIASVRNQTYSSWELFLVDDGSTNPHVRDRLRDQLDPRIKVHFSNENKGISGATNVALSMATGDHIALLDHDDMITNDALWIMAQEIAAFPNADLIYSDECKIDGDDIASDLHLKPDWSPVLLTNSMYTGHFSVYRKSSVIAAGGFRSEYDFSQDYDLALRVCDLNPVVRHVKKVLYGWRMATGSAASGDKPFARKSNIAALQDSARRRQIDAEAVQLPTANRLMLSSHAFTEFVSIIIPSDNGENITNCVRSVLEKTTYANYEILVVTNSRLIAQLKNEGLNEVSFVPYDQKFNFSDKCNAGADNARGDVLLFLNDDIRVMTEDWIQAIVESFRFGKVGAIGPKLLYENGTIQHAGMVSGVRRLVGTAFHCLPEDFTAVGNLAQSVREVSLICGACLAIKGDLFQEIGGFDAVNVPIAHSDVDLCFKVAEKGYSCLYTPHATLLHIGHVSIGATDKSELKESGGVSGRSKADIFLLKRWPLYTGYDPYFPPTMRDTEYRDSPEQYDIFANVDVYHGGGKDILIASHDLTLSGAPKIVHQIARGLKEHGHFVVVASAADGAYRQILERDGIPVIVDSLLFREHDSVLDFAKNFDAIIASTVVSWPFVHQVGQHADVYWFIQEEELVTSVCQAEPRAVEALSIAKAVWANSERCAKVIRPFHQVIKIIDLGLDPIDTVPLVSGNGKINIVVGGSYEWRKGQDIAAEAIRLLPEIYRNQISVRMFGRVLDTSFYQYLTDSSRDLPEIALLGELPPEKALEETVKADVVLVPSRSDALNLVAFDGLRSGRIVVVSPNTGASDYIQNGTTGFVAEETSAAGMAAALLKALERRQEWSDIGGRAKSLFQGSLSHRSFIENVRKGIFPI